MAKQISDNILAELYKRTPYFIKSSYTKKEGYKYRPKMEAFTLDFITYNQGENLWFLSLDIDFPMSLDEIENICFNYEIPYPTIILPTTKGIHIHWFLENFISKFATPAQAYFSDIKKQLVRVFRADPHASGKVRVFRNPLTHKCYYHHMAYKLNDFRNFLDIAKEEVKRTTVRKPSAHRFESKIDFTKVYEGERNVMLFTALRKFGYSVWARSDKADLIEQEALKLNSQMPDPLPISEVETICKSIVKWLDDNYNPNVKAKKASDEIIKYNRKLAAKKASTAFNKVFLFYLEKTNEMTLAELKKIPLREVAALTKTSKNTVLKYKQRVIKLIQEKLLEDMRIARSEWVSLGLNSFEIDIKLPSMVIASATTIVEEYFNCVENLIE